MGMLRTALAFGLPVLLSLAVYAGLHAEHLTMPLPSLLPVVDIEPSRLPRPSPLEGPYAPNQELRRAVRLFEGKVQGSESVAFGRDGSLYLLDKFGYLHKARPGKEGGYELQPEPEAYLGPGRPLGFHFDQLGNLIICDSLKGLTMLIFSMKRLVVLASRASTSSPIDPGSPINYANDLDIARNGSIFFSDSTAIPPALNRGGWYDTMRSYLLTMWQGGATGRLLEYDPSTFETKVLAKGLWYANGVALSPGEDFVAVVETASMRVRRYWRLGPKAGTTDVLISGLPGFPDGISRTSDGNFWLTLLTPDMPAVHKLLPHKLARWAVAWLPGVLLPKIPQWGMVLKVSPEGEVLRTLMDPDGSHISHVSAVTERGGKLFLGNLAKDYVSVLDL